MNQEHQNNTTEQPQGHTLSSEEWLHLASEQSQEIERLKGLLEAQRSTPSNPSPQQDNPYKGRAVRARAQAGEMAWLHKMSRAQKLAAIGADTSISDDFLRKLFGRGFDANLQREMTKSEFPRYCLLRECARALDLGV